MQIRSTKWIRAAWAASLILAASTAVEAKSLYVEQWGEDASGCGGKSAPCRSIGFLWDAFLVQKNDRIIVGPGVYSENLLILQDGVRLESTAGRFATYIEADSPGLSVIRIGADRVRIGRKGKGFTVQGASSSYGIVVLVTSGDRVAIEGNRVLRNQLGMWLGGTRMMIRDNMVKDNSDTGIYCVCGRSQVRDNQVLDNGDFGIRLLAADSTQVSRNVVTGHDDGGIFFESTGTSGAQLRDNVVDLSDGGHGILVEDAESALVQGNIVARNLADGMNISQWDSGSAPRIRNNLAVANQSSGIELSALMSARIEGNSSVQSAVSGFSLAYFVSAANFQSNNAIRNGACSVGNSSSTPLVAKRFYEYPGSSACGNISNQSTGAAKPNPLRVNVASRL